MKSPMTDIKAIGARVEDEYRSVSKGLADDFNVRFDAALADLRTLLKREAELVKFIREIGPLFIKLLTEGCYGVDLGYPTRLVALVGDLPAPDGGGER